MSQTRVHAKACCQPQPCDCPICRGLECFERPRYFAGQLLTEAELNTEQEYVRAKNRLHNRYLHGWGVVCGLEVVCHDCEGWVTVKPGYALDPCGEDIVVCTEQRFHLLEAINRCRNAHRKPRHADCDPFVPGTEPHCREVEETWCVTIAYDEVEARPMATLRTNTAEPCGCLPDPCGCASNSGSRGAAKRTNGQAASATTASRGGVSLGTCEPTRIRETFRLGVIEEPPACQVPALFPNNDDNLSTASKAPTFTESVLSGTLFEQLRRCLTDPIAWIGKRLKPVDQNALVAILDTPTPANVLVPQMHDAVCRLRQAVIDLYLAGGHRVRCQLLHTLDKILCPEPGPNETPASYATTARPVVIHLVMLVLQFMLDCLCLAFLPRCSPDPCDERVILACVTVRGDTILRICNFGCRRYAGAFPSLFHWLSLVPVIPFFKQLLTLLCCSPDLVRTQSPVVDEGLAFLERVDPTGKLRRSVIAGDFALPKTVAADLRSALPKFVGQQLSRILASDTVSLPSLVGQSPKEARQQLKGVEITEQEVASEQDVPPLWVLRMNPFVAPGEGVVMYRTRDRVLGFAKAPAAAVAVPKSAGLDELREEIAALRDQVKALEKKRGK